MINNKVISDSEQIKRILNIYSVKPKSFLCPFNIVQGSYDVLNGAITDDPNIDQSQNYAKFFRGDNFVIAQWENSTFLKNTRTDGLMPTTSDMVTHYQPGVVYDAWLENDTYTTNSSDGYITTNVQIRMYSNKQLNEADYYKLYVIPGVNQSYYRIATLTNYFNPDGGFLQCAMTFEKITTIANADNLESIIMNGSVGEGYAWPKIVGTSVQLDQDKLQSRGVAYIQVQFDDPIALGTYYAIGRPKTSLTQQDTKLEEPRIILNRDFVQPDGNKLSGGVPSNDSYYFASNCILEMRTQYESWSDTMLRKYSPEALKNYKGILVDVNSVSQTLTSNPSTNTQPVWNNFTIPNVSQLYQTLNGMTANGANVDSSEGFNLNGSYKFGDMLNHNIFIGLHKQILPLSYAQVYPRATTTIPIIGGLTKFFFMGSPTGWWNVNEDRNKLDKLGLFISKDYYDLVINATSIMKNDGAEEKNLPLDMFGEDRPEDIFSLSTGINVFKSKLSDQFYKNNDTSVIYNTKDLGVDYNADGIADLLWTPDCKTFAQTGVTNFEFFIDRFVVQAYGETIGYVTFYDINNKEILTQKFLTAPKATGVDRNWTTVIKTSSWTSDTEFMSETGEVIEPVSPYVTPLSLDRSDKVDFEWMDGSGNMKSEYRWRPYFYEVNTGTTRVHFIGTRTNRINDNNHIYQGFANDLVGTNLDGMLKNSYYGKFGYNLQNPLEWNNGTDWQNSKEIEIDLSAYKTNFINEDPKFEFNNIDFKYNIKTFYKERTGDKWGGGDYKGDISDDVGEPKFATNLGLFPTGDIFGADYQKREYNLRTNYKAWTNGENSDNSFDEQLFQVLNATINPNNEEKYQEIRSIQGMDKLGSFANANYFPATNGEFKVTFNWDNINFILKVNVVFCPAYQGFSTGEYLQDFLLEFTNITFWNNDNPPKSKTE